MTMKTKHRQQKEAKAFYTDYIAMTAPNKGGEKVVDIEPVMEQLMKKYGIYARSTCYAIIHRVEARIARGEGA